MILKGYNFAVLTPIPHLLLAYGANVEALTPNHETLLHFASMHGCFDIARDLFERGANVNATTFSCGRTPLHFAARFASTNMVRWLLSHAACPTSLDRDGKTPGQLCRKTAGIGMDETLNVLDQETQRRSEDVAMGLDQPQSIMHKFHKDLFKTLLEDCFEHD